MKRLGRWMLAATTACALAIVGCAEEPTETVGVSEDEASASGMLPAYETEAEKKKGAKADSYDDYRLANPQWYAITAPPAKSYRHMTEWESMDMLLTTYSDGMPFDKAVRQTIIDIIVATVKTANSKVGVVYNSASAKNDLVAGLGAAGLSGAQISSMVEFLQFQNDTIWHIDYGPLFLVDDAEGSLAIADFRYYHQRVLDDGLPTKLGQSFGMTTYRMPYDIEGGTFQGDGKGTCFTGERALQYAGTPVSELEQVWKDYAACDQVVVMKDITDDGTGHIDMFFKLAGPELAILGEYKDQYVIDATNKKRMNDNQALLESITLAGSKKLSVLRLPFPSKANGVPRTYLNSTLINGVNLWPIYTDSKTAEAEALTKWKQALPSYQHVGIICDKIASYSGTVHCITRTIPKGTAKKWVADGTCTNGVCQSAAGGYTGACISGACWGPAWVSGGTGTDCGSVTYEGCCTGSTLSYCDGGTLKSGACPDGCGWDAGGGYYNCGFTGADPSGQNPIVCGGGTCTPSCGGKACGSDGCGGSCGSCGAGTACESGQCVATGGDCGDVTFEGCCDGTTLSYCDNGKLQSGDCPSGCGWDATNGYYNCGFTGADPSGVNPHQCGGGSTCTPLCAGKTCGDDGCEGSCGTCGAGTTCQASQCVPTGGGCGGVTFEGCCDGQNLSYCENDQLVSGACNGACGWDPASGYYNCGFSGADPSGQNPIACPGTTCTPSCAGKTCGDDGCGGSCGTCGGGETCSAGQCVSGCGGVTFEGCCDGSALSYCENNALVSGDCPNGCGWDATNGYYNCGFTGADPSGENPLACGGVCTPTCGGKACGDDGCGGSCGSCSGGQTCTNGQCVTQCAPSCAGKSCGADGCGGICGTCAAGEACTLGQCVIQCTPSCAGKTCGTDGCGGTCGSCGATESCQAGTCVGGCSAQCAGKECGDDGCGGSCGGCTPGSTCDAGQCVCTPSCDGKSCGSDGCGGSCGDCEVGATCNAGVCEAGCVPDCAGKACGSDGCTGTCGECAAGESCNAGVCEAGCVPDCAGKACGDDGCNGTCGACAEGESCTAGVCEAGACVPDCAGKDCGSDGCEGTCGECDAGQTCNAGTCEAGACMVDCEGKTCGDDGCGGSCGECATGESCNAGTCEAGCVPACEGLSCGSDGCGGSCGECATGESCTAGACVAGVEPDAGTGEPDAGGDASTEADTGGVGTPGGPGTQQPGGSSSGSGCQSTTGAAPQGALALLLLAGLVALRRRRTC